MFTKDIVREALGKREWSYNVDITCSEKIEELTIPHYSKTAKKKKKSL